MMVDLIPFGEIENSEGETVLSDSVFALKMHGFKEVLPFVESVSMGGITINVCPIEGIILLKLLSNHDNSQRTHDLTDIDLLIDAYFDWHSDEIYENHHDVFDNYETSDIEFFEKKIAAHVIGRKLKRLLLNNPSLKAKIAEILNKRENPRWLSMQKGLGEP